MHSMRIICDICGEELGVWTREAPWSEDDILLAKQMIRCDKCPEMTEEDVTLSEIPNE